MGTKRMEALLRRWKLLASDYKRESGLIHEKMTDLLIHLSKEDIQKLNFEKWLTQLEKIVCDSHDTFEEVLTNIIEDDDDDEDDNQNDMGDETGGRENPSIENSDE